MRNYKIVVFVPETHGERLRAAMGEAGAGRIGNYGHCSFSVRGVGRFTPLPGAHPSLGAVGRPEAVAEERVETVCTNERLREVLDAIRSVHPYEEPAIDVYALETLE